MNIFQKAIKEAEEFTNAIEYPKLEKENKTMYGLKLYIPFEDLNTYIHNHIDEKYKDHTFIPIKVEVNDIGLDIEISLLSANPIESDGSRYKLNLNELPKENKL